MTILVTRPQAAADRLVDRLRQLGLIAWSMPLIDFQPSSQLCELPQKLAQLNDGDSILAISQQAADYAGATLYYNHTAWPANVDYYAIGRKTALALHTHCQQPVISPPAGSVSETLLELPSLQYVSGQKILILRGNGGRELIAETLRARGALVEYCECYQRIPRIYNGEQQARHWRNLGITTIIVTSVDMLTLLYELFPEQDRIDWLLHCRLIVVSDRLATMARKLGFLKLVVADSADNDALIRALS